jgi:hypothetical protein
VHQHFYKQLVEALVLLALPQGLMLLVLVELECLVGTVPDIVQHFLAVVKEDKARVLVLVPLAGFQFHLH